MSKFDEAVAHTIKYFELHRLDGLEWRVISDIEAGVIAITAVEESVLRRFAKLPHWPHQVVTFFVLQDLTSLQRQLAARSATMPAGSAKMNLPAGGIAELAQRPVVNLYDLADLAACHVFVNHAAMVEAGYWGDEQAEMALLAHEHAHPMVETRTVRAARQLALTTTLTSHVALSTQAEDRWCERLQEVVQSVCERLCSYAPRELFTNSLAVAAGFDAALCHLDRVTIERAALALPGRAALIAGLRAQPELTDIGRRAFLLVADLQAHLEMAFEVAAFRKEGAEVCANQLEQLLSAKLFPALTADVGRIFPRLTEAYAALDADLAPVEFTHFVRTILILLAETFAGYGITIRSEISTDVEKEGRLGSTDDKPRIDND